MNATLTYSCNTERSYKINYKTMCKNKESKKTNGKFGNEFKQREQEKTQALAIFSAKSS
jgi:hypothetical protein